MKNLLTLSVILLACNAPAKEVKNDSTMLAVAASADSAVTAVSAAPQQVITVETGDITRQEFEQNKTSCKSDITYDSLQFRTVNGVTTINCNNGSVSFKDNAGVPHDEDRLAFRFAGELKALNKYLVEVRGYEHGFYILLDKASGRKDTVSNTPHVSPDGRWIVCEKEDPYAEQSPSTDIDIYTVDNGTVKQVYHKAFRWIARDLCWKDESMVYVKAARGEGETAAIDYARLTIVTGGNKATTAATSAAWYGTYSFVLNKDSKDSRDQLEVQLQVTKDSTIYTESGYQVYSKYSLSNSEKDGTLSFAFRHVLDGGSGVLERENRFGHIQSTTGGYSFECPYLDARTGSKKKIVYTLEKK
ncbi:MAG TPA: hypothetical protein VM802_17335 [Chitinophaga sp.]|uniref:hypothetical protein n=1 Tax=Chitinophaga sp. TaxID=1869181 RepID=UPI002B57195F|nr:hypothetical protein [Chitinophaga sp.]HVI46645.1 hypothetical protein [Chitinophaga sp.]